MQPLVNVEAERARIGMTKGALAKHLGVTDKTLRLWTDSKNPIPTDKIIEMAVLFNCSVDYLLGMTSNRERG